LVTPSEHAKMRALLVVGSQNNSNSNRLREPVTRAGVPAYLIDDADSIERDWLRGKEAIGLTAGTSAPEVLVQSVVERLRQWGAAAPENIRGREEKVAFSLPRELRVS
jgi:4-hydroxy-3-methylbut-2-enyl diphosphate reductase